MPEPVYLALRPACAPRADKRASRPTAVCRLFKPLTRYTTGSHQPSFPNAGRIGFRCRDDREAARIDELIELLETEYETVQRQLDKRLLAEITNTTLIITR